VLGRFLLNYGFAVEDNRDPDGRCHNEVRFYFDLERHDPSLGFKLSLLGNDLPGRGLRISANHDDQNSIEALSYARFICARVCIRPAKAATGPNSTDSQCCARAQGNEIMLLPRLDNDYDLQEHPIPPLSLDTELRVLELLHRLASEQLSRYPTTLEEDYER